MDKKAVKQIEITEVKVNRLSSSSDESGEYTTHCNVDFFLNQPVTFMVFDRTHMIDRIKMTTNWGDETELFYANHGDHFHCFPVSKTLIHKVYDRVRSEQKDGCLKGWGFDDDILEMLHGDRKTSSFW